MFTGLVQNIGKVSSINRNTEGILLTIESSEIASQVKIDDSVAINGACQTVTAFTESTFTVQAVHTTLEKTTFKSFKVGTSVNLELALRLSDRLGGHLVQGHVNGIAKVLGWQSKGNNYLLQFEIPEALLKYTVKEGSITLNGVSLTISSLDPYKRVGEVSIIPHTWQNTIFATSKVGQEINLEVDVIAKYVENLLLYGNKSKTNESKITEEWLGTHGF